MPETSSEPEVIAPRNAAVLPYGTRPPVLKRAGGRLRRWASATFTREQLISSIKSLLWVAPLTVLIWVYAEREQVAKVPNHLIAVEVTSADPKKVVTLLRPADGLVAVDLSGPRGRLEAVREKLDPRNNQPPVRIEVSAELPPGTHNIPAALVTRDPRLANSGVSIDGTNPRFLEVFVDPIVQRELQVAPRPDLRTGLLAEPPTFDPPAVRVTAPKSVLDEAEMEAARVGGELVAYAELEGKALATPGPQTVPVRVTLPFQGAHVAAAPDTVRANVNVRRADETFTIELVPVLVAMPEGLQEEVVVELSGGQQTLTDVEVVGPAEQIKLLRDDNYPKPKAVLEVGRDDLGKKALTRKVHFVGLPEGVKVSPEDAERKVGFQLVGRDEAAD